ncbi:hypothetical protein BRC2024_ULFKEANI_CDS_0191 [Acinetobacter phage vB_AbaM_Konradin-v2]
MTHLQCKKNQKYMALDVYILGHCCYNSHIKSLIKLRKLS